MRFAFLVFCLLIGSPAMAATTPAPAPAACSRPVKPVFPDPKTAEPAVVEKLDQAMQKYSTGMNAYVQCLSHEAQDAEAEGSATINAYNQKFLAEYNKRATAK